MGRGVSYGGGQSSLGYLFGSDEPPKAASADGVVTSAPVSGAAGGGKENSPASTEVSPTVAKTTPGNAAIPDIAAGQLGSNPNNYHRADGQNTGNFITDRPSTKVHSAPGGGSSLGYLFGGGN